VIVVRRGEEPDLPPFRTAGRGEWEPDEAAGEVVAAEEYPGVRTLEIPLQGEGAAA